MKITSQIVVGIALVIMFSCCIIISSLSYASSENSKKLVSPKKQMENGTLPENVVCIQNYVLIQKPSKSIACVKIDTAIKLVDRNWNVLKASEDNIIEVVLKNDPRLENYVKTDAILVSLTYLDENHTAYEINDTNNRAQKYTIIYPGESIFQHLGGHYIWKIIMHHTYPSGISTIQETPLDIIDEQSLKIILQSHIP